jgi:hypothetical protein
MGLGGRVKKYINSSNSYDNIHQTSKKSETKNPFYNIKIKQSNQSSIDSSDNKKHPCNFSEVLWICEFFHNHTTWKIKNTSI